MALNFGKIGFFTGLTTFVLMILGVRNVLGHSLEFKNYLAFIVFGLIVGVISAALVFYKLKIAFPIFMVALLFGFIELFRNFIMNPDGWGDLIGILSLFIITSFGTGVALIVEFIMYLIRKNKK